VRYADPEPIRAAVRGYAEALRAAHPEVRALRWFGSWVKGPVSVDSDVDLCLIVDRSDQARRDRIPNYLPRTFPVDIDLFIFTEEEFARVRRWSGE
jgi:predicted nucleotidyltransferase